MTRPQVGSRWFVALCLVGLGLGLFPATMAARWRGLVRDALRPGQSLLLKTAKQVTRDGSSRTELADVRNRAQVAEERARQLELRVERLERLVRAADVPRGKGGDQARSDPLFVPQLVSARVLGEVSRALRGSLKLVGAGTAGGVVPQTFVLDETQTLVDQGVEAQVSVGDAVYAGRSVIGKIVEAGQYASTLQLVTDAGYSGRARLARRTHDGLAFGAEGTLTGSGESVCRLKRIQEPVNVGDEVYTGGTDGVLPYPMYYGRVVRAELEPGAAEWTIDVKPAAKLDQLDDVLILRLAVNQARLLAD